VSIKKPSAQSLARKQEVLARLKEHLASLAVMARGQDGEFWRSLKGNLQNVALGAQKRINEAAVPDGRPRDERLEEITYQAGCKFTAEQTILMVDNIEEYSVQAEARIKSLQAEIEEMLGQQTEGVF